MLIHSTSILSIFMPAAHTWECVSSRDLPAPPLFTWNLWVVLNSPSLGPLHQQPKKATGKSTCNDLPTGQERSKCSKAAFKTFPVKDLQASSFSPNAGQMFRPPCITSSAQTQTTAWLAWPKRNQKQHRTWFCHSTSVLPAKIALPSRAELLCPEFLMFQILMIQPGG